MSYCDGEQSLIGSEPWKAALRNFADGALEVEKIGASNMRREGWLLVLVAGGLVVADGAWLTQRLISGYPQNLVLPELTLAIQVTRPLASKGLSMIQNGGDAVNHLKGLIEGRRAPRIVVS